MIEEVTRNGGVYAAEFAGGMLKIGRTNCISRRLTSLAWVSRRELVRVVDARVLPEPMRDDAERFLLRQLRPFVVFGEWHTLSDESLVVLRQAFLCLPPSEGEIVLRFDPSSADIRELHQRLGRMGGAERARRLTPERRKEIARQGGQASAKNRKKVTA